MKHLIFIYCNLKSGFKQHRKLGKSIKLGETIIDGFEMYNINGSPGIIRGEGEILGEVYEINNPHCLRKIYNTLERVEEENEFNFNSLYALTPWGRAEVMYIENEDEVINNYLLIKDGYWDIDDNDKYLSIGQ